MRNRKRKRIENWISVADNTRTASNYLKSEWILKKCFVFLRLPSILLQNFRSNLTFAFRVWLFPPDYITPNENECRSPAQNCYEIHTFLSLSSSVKWTKTLEKVHANFSRIISFVKLKIRIKIVWLMCNFAALRSFCTLFAEATEMREICAQLLNGNIFVNVLSSGCRYCMRVKMVFH